MFLFILTFYLFSVVFMYPIHLPVSSYQLCALPCKPPPALANNKIRKKRKKVNKMENVVLEAALWHVESHSISISPSIYLYCKESLICFEASNFCYYQYRALRGVPLR